MGIFWVAKYVIFDNVLIFVENKDAQTNTHFLEVTFTNDKKKVVTFKNNKIIILDFWLTTCAICFSKFPDLESTYLKYKKNPNVMIYAVNVPIRNDQFEKTTTILTGLGYTFPKIYANSAKQIEDSLKINSFPHLLILKNGKIRYNGILETSKHVVIYSVESQIEKLLKEENYPQ